jgi:uncharacterized membrane protein
VAEPAVVTDRVVGVDVARGVALLGMMAVHCYDTFTDNGGPTVATAVAGGRSAATFVFVAGVSLAFLSGGRTAVRGQRLLASSAGIAVRAVLVGLVGLALAVLDSPVDVILVQYAVMFLLAIPLLGVRQRVLAMIAAGFALLGPVLLVATAGLSLPYAGDSQDPEFGVLIHDPMGTLVLLLVTGAYPVCATWRTFVPGWPSAGSI